VHKVPKVFKEQLEHKVLKVSKEQLEHKVLKAFRVHKVSRVL
jgi:hypothetical protein